ncbi:MAG: hypothetical protein Q8P26_02750 [Candidatus Levybacteria bacterium]|nr:hypothetical protein [Candidatus Levybacteria bacterium]
MIKFFKKIKLKSQRGLPASRLSNRQLQAGITVIELLLYMTILTVLLSILTSIFVSALDAQAESKAVSSVEQDGNYILNKLAYDIHRAQSISIPSANGVIADNFEILINGVSHRYFLDAGKNLILSNNSGTNNLNNYGSSISSFSVQRLGNAGGVEDALRISFTITSRIKRISGVEAKNFQTNLSLRRQ